MVPVGLVHGLANSPPVPMVSVLPLPVAVNVPVFVNEELEPAVAVPPAVASMVPALVPVPLELVKRDRDSRFARRVGLIRVDDRVIGQNVPVDAAMLPADRDAGGDRVRGARRG